MAKFLVYQWPNDRRSIPRETDPTMRWVSADAALIERLFAREQVRMKRQSEMLAQGYIGILCVEGDEWLAHAWMRRPRSPGPPHLPNEARRLPCFWITYCRTKDEYQGRGLFTTAILRLVGVALEEDPLAKIFIDAASTNHASQKAIVRAGFSPSGVVRTIKIGVPGVAHVVIGSWRHP